MTRNNISRLSKAANAMLTLALLLVANAAFAADDTPRKIDTSKVPPIDSLAISSDSLMTSGLPKPEHFAALAEADVEVIINVLSPIGDHRPDLCAIQAAGLAYATVTFDKAAPVASMEAFRATMEMMKGKNVLVSCRRGNAASVMAYSWHKIMTGEDNHKLVRGRRSLADMIESVEAETQRVLYEYIEPLEAHYGVKIASE